MKKFLKKNKMREDMPLQITAMADIFTVLLVFLLKSYATGVSTITPTGEMILPEAHAETPTRESMKLEVTLDGVAIDQKRILTLKNFEFTDSDLGANGTSTKLYQALLNERQKQKLKEADATMIVMADQRTPYSTMRTVLNSLATSGFVDLDLVVVESQ